ncbi:hypothetical protein B0T26DRAFT_5977 [Lasiosphaeria miniovina]|uniref:Uncharacterized protein n=1 Tax=Lasiosphaeria miniovina TaxID=1954250 RepID=A0AA40EAT2_9PEZI|nr:uncharacterized protein B0T26DRAFT_5977 [Lasiosphaeria miniovina]KAK0733115.1 hypothetical protein B0T26DRAFT_5977 [Lasiosphaeria miniovina]
MWTTTRYYLRVGCIKMSYAIGKLKHGISDWTRADVFNFVSLAKARRYLDQDSLNKPISESYFHYAILEAAIRQDHTLPYDDALRKLEPLAPENQDAIVWERLRRVYRYLVSEEAKPHPTWKEVIAQRTENEWLEAILSAIHPDAKPVLSSAHPPTIANLKTLPFTRCKLRGVYGKIRSPLREKYSSSECNIYIGSATGKHGLYARFKSHIRNDFDAKAILWDQVAELEQPSISPYYFTLLTLPEHVPELEQRLVCLIAEAILMVYLGAHSGSTRTGHPIYRYAAWPAGELPYTGSSGMNPLWNSYSTVDLHEGIKGRAARGLRMVRNWPGGPDNKHLGWTWDGAQWIWPVVHNIPVTSNPFEMPLSTSEDMRGHNSRALSKQKRRDMRQEWLDEAANKRLQRLILEEEPEDS